jgi:ATP-dependent RNA helicase SUPV3L1/SUV3
MINSTLKEQLHNLLNCDLKTLYPVARSLKRKLYFYVGPTNSGKTYKAMEELINADCGTYLAPLRLLALENYENLKSKNIPVSLVTGEEERFDEDAGHICSTIEMIDFNLDVDVCIIDEVQMIDDIDRGWAWVNAIVGCPARKVIMTGSVNALDAVKKIAIYLGEDLEIVKFKRKNPLEVMSKPVSLRQIQSGTALIAFSRADVLKIKSRLSKYHKVSVLYGNLSPEVRQDEAKRFRDGDTDILVATDAIAMGLNLPIKTILFTTDTKFDGISKRKLIPNEIIQIAGRSGRYGHHEVGFIGATSKKVLEHIASQFNAPLHTIKPPFKVKATASQIQDLSTHLKTKNLSQILKYFSKHMKFDGPFEAINLSTMIELSKILDQKNNMKLEDKYLLSQAPVSTKSPLIRSAYFHYINAVMNNTVVNYKSSVNPRGSARTQKELLKAEDEVKKISLYLWIAYKLPNLFPDAVFATNTRAAVNKYCESSLKNRKIDFDIKEQSRRENRDKRDYGDNDKRNGNRNSRRTNRDRRKRY